MKRINSEKVLLYCEKENVSTIFIDFFDTIVSRRVHPEYVKYLAARLFITKSGLNVSPQFLYLLRSTVERELSLKNQRKNGSSEFKIDELAQALYEYFKSRVSTDLSDFVSLFISCELQVELEVLYVNEDIIDLMHDIKSDNKQIKIYILSDFYIPKRYFKDIVQNLKIENLFDKIYISSDYSVTKRSGELYDKILKLEKLDPHNVIMIGDNQEVDFDRALDNKIKAFLVDNSRVRKFYDTTFKEQLDNKLAKNKFDQDIRLILSKYRKDVVFPEVPVLLYAFTEKLYEQLIKEDFKQVVFCSKEGFFLKQLFDLYQKKYIGEEIVESRYIKVSRRSTYTPSLKPLRNEKFDILFRQYKDISVEQFLKNFHFTDSQRKQILSEIDIKIDRVIKDFHKSKWFKKVLNSKTFKKYYEIYRQNQKKLFQKYLEAEISSNKFKKLVFVDVGWKGTIQDNIYRFFNGEKEVSGKYLGLLFQPESVISYKNNKEGLLFTNNPVSKNIQVYSRMTSLFEILLAAPHGSAKLYKQEGTKVLAITEEIELEEQRYRKEIGPLQEQYLQIFQEILDIRMLDHHKISSYQNLLDIFMARIQFTPTKKELKFFADTEHYENFGLFEYTRFSSDKKFSPVRYIKDFLYFVLSFKWIFETGWGVYRFYINGFPILGKALGFIYYKKFFNRNKT